MRYLNFTNKVNKQTKQAGGERGGKPIRKYKPKVIKKIFAFFLNHNKNYHRMIEHQDGSGFKDPLVQTILTIAPCK